MLSMSATQSPHFTAHRPHQAFSAHHPAVSGRAARTPARAVMAAGPDNIIRAGWPVGSPIGPVLATLPVPAAAPCPAMPRPAMAAALVAAGGWPWVLAKGMLACLLGLGLKRALDRANAGFVFPPDIHAVPDLQLRKNAVNTLSAVACLACFVLL